MYDLSITKNANISIIYELNKKYTIFFFRTISSSYLSYTRQIRLKNWKKYMKLKTEKKYKSLSNNEHTRWTQLKNINFYKLNVKLKKMLMYEIELEAEK